MGASRLDNLSFSRPAPDAPTGPSFLPVKPPRSGSRRHKGLPRVTTRDNDFRKTGAKPSGRTHLSLPQA